MRDASPTARGIPTAREGRKKCPTPLVTTASPSGAGPASLQFSSEAFQSRAGKEVSNARLFPSRFQVAADECSLSLRVTRRAESAQTFSSRRMAETDVL